MNERDLRLLQAAAAAADSTIHEADDALNAVDDDNMELVVADLSADEINAALQALVGEMEERHDDKGQDLQPPPPLPPPPPARSTSNPNTATANKFDFDTTEDSLENLKRLLGLDDNPALDTIDDLRQHNGSVVASGMDQSRPIDHEGHLADLQRSLTELPNPTTRTNSPPTQGSTMPEANPQATANLVNWLSALVGPSTDAPAPPPAPAPPAQPRGRTRQSSIPDPFEDPVKAAERDRIRVENRERKKKWRTQNQERNKDNDLRCRVTKRAAQLYGTLISAEKTFWVEREFNRRRYKRVTRKEQRIIDNPASNNPNAGSSSVFPAFSNSNSSSPPPGSSPAAADTGSVIYSEGAQPGDDMVEVMHALTTLSGEPGMFATLVGVAVASGYDERALQARRDRSITPSVSTCGGDNEHFTDIIESPAIVVDQLRTWTPEASATPRPGDTLCEPQQGFLMSAEDLERINHVETGFEALVASLESGLKEHCENSVSEENNEDHGVKPEPTSPNQLPTDHWTSAQTLEVLEFDNLPEESLDSAIAELLKSQSDGEGAVVVNATETEEDFSDEDIQRLLAEGGEDMDIILNSMGAVGTAAATQTQGTNEHVEEVAVGDEDRIELVQRISNLAPEEQPERGESAGFTMDAEDLPIADGMTLEEINSLLADLNGGGDSGPMQLDPPISQPQQEAATPIHVPVPNSPPFNPDPDTSALYTRDTIIAIFKAILDLSPNPPPLPKRGIKRSSPSAYDNNSPNKRHCGYIPGNPNANTSMNAATMSALNQLSGILSSPGFVRRSPPAQVKTQAYVSSFGTTDGMNKRLVAMKPPPYRLNGSGVNGCGAGIGVTGVQTKRKTGDEEKKVRAMGFPPLMAGMGRKA